MEQKSVSDGPSLFKRLERHIRMWRDRRRLVHSGLFDSFWYRENNPDLPQRIDAARHFLQFGAREGRKPHPLFDTSWYTRENPDVAPHNPVLHYLLFGAIEPRDPNAYFSGAWYLAAYPDVVKSGVNPLAHYIAHGAREGRRPSARFDPTFYLRQLPKDHPAKVQPLAHFLTEGVVQGLQPAPEIMSSEGDPVEWSTMHAVRPWTRQGSEPVAIFVTAAKDAQLKPHVLHHLEALAKRRIGTILVIASSGMFNGEIPDGLASVYIRENTGFDFAAWAHVLKLFPSLWDSQALYLLNDSVIGPTNQSDYDKMMDRAESSSADIIGLTESVERGWHLQSYFLLLKASALANAQLQAFFNMIRNLPDKQFVIDRYEVAFAGKAIEAGLKTQTLFPRAGVQNPTLFEWQGLIGEGFPFLKASVVTERYDDVDSTGWRDHLNGKGFDLLLAEALLKDAPPASIVAPRYQMAPRPWKPEKIAFYGPWNYLNGLGEASRGYLSALWHLQQSLNIHGLKTPFHIHRRLSPGYDIRDFIDPADVAIVHLNPDGWHLLTPEQRRDIDRARIRIGIWVWEMNHVPEFFRPQFDAVDVIWAPSHYCAEVFSAATDRSVHVVPHAVPVPPQAPSRGIRRNILYTFDGSSYLVRKNPMALLTAFERSGLAKRGWTLTLKTKHLAGSGSASQAFIDRCLKAEGVKLIDKPLPRQALCALLRYADIYASPHSSEGFGLTIAEAMAAGKLVVATDYGGSRDFLDPLTGYPVPYNLVTLQEDHGHYRTGGVWADVDVVAFSEALMRAAETLERGDHDIGFRARRRVAEQLSAKAVSEAMSSSFAQITPLAARLEQKRA